MSPYFDGCYFDPAYFDAAACVVSTGGRHPRMPWWPTGEVRPVIRPNDDDLMLALGVL